MITHKRLLSALIVAAAAGTVGTASAATVTWTDWTQIGATGAAGDMGGVSVNVTSVGNMDGVSQTTCGFNYWGQPDPTRPAYTGGSVDNAPTACEQVGMNSPATVTVSFGSAIDTLYMALLSVGQFPVQVTYDFDRDFVVDSTGVGHWSGNAVGPHSEGAGDTLAMNEFHGVLRFTSPVTSLTFATSPSEYWHAFTFGTTQAVPEPGSLALLGVALAGLAASLRRRR